VSRAELSDERLAELAALPPDHPDIRAVAADPERMARLVALREFLYPQEAPPGARTDEARARLRGAVREALGVAPAAEPGRAVAAPRLEVPADRTRRGWWFGGWGSALAAAAVVVVVGALFYPRFMARKGVLRGTPGAAVEVLAPEFTADIVVFRWRAVPEAEQYDLRFLTADLSPARPAIATRDTSVEVPVTGLFPTSGNGAAAFWRVSAWREGAQVAESDLSSLEPPRAP
jgi:hypothetical protein